MLAVSASTPSPRRAEHLAPVLISVGATMLLIILIERISPIWTWSAILLQGLLLLSSRLQARWRANARVLMYPVLLAATLYLWDTQLPPPNLPEGRLRTLIPGIVLLVLSVDGLLLLWRQHGGSPVHALRAVTQGLLQGGEQGVVQPVRSARSAQQQRRFRQLRQLAHEAAEDGDLHLVSWTLSAALLAATTDPQRELVLTDAQRFDVTLQVRPSFARSDDVVSCPQHSRETLARQLDALIGPVLLAQWSITPQLWRTFRVQQLRRVRLAALRELQRYLVAIVGASIVVAVLGLVLNGQAQGARAALATLAIGVTGALAVAGIALLRSLVWGWWRYQSIQQVTLSASGLVRDQQLTRFDDADRPLISVHVEPGAPALLVIRRTRGYPQASVETISVPVPHAELQRVARACGALHASMHPRDTRSGG
jgi:hypothetical protein